MRHISLRILMIGILMVCAIWIAHSTRIIAPIESGIGTVVSRMGVFSTDMAHSVRKSIEPFIKKEQTPVEVLKDRVKKLEIENAALMIAQIENDTLRRQLTFLRRSKLHTLLAHRIGWTTDARRSGFVIDKGKKDGITLSAPVMTDDGIFIGKISALQESTSNITLANDSKSKVTVIIASDTHPTSGVVNGQFGLGLMVDLIPMAEKIALDDIVETSGLEDGIPAGLLIGAISKINTHPTDLFQTASVRPAVDYAHIRIVSVVLPEQ